MGHGPSGDHKPDRIPAKAGLWPNGSVAFATGLKNVIEWKALIVFENRYVYIPVILIYFALCSDLAGQEQLSSGLERQPPIPFALFLKLKQERIESEHAEIRH
jgi:hypothetical protein